MACWKSAYAPALPSSAAAHSTHATGLVMCILPRAPSALENGRNAHAAGGANRDQPALGARILGENLGERRDDARAGGGERVAEGHAATLHVEARTIDASERRGEAERVAAVIRRLPRLERAQHLRGERFVNLVVIEVLQAESGIGEHR